MCPIDTCAPSNSRSNADPADPRTDTIAGDVVGPNGQVAADWGLHLWQVNAAGQYLADYPGVSWGAPFARTGLDAYGAYFDLPASAFTDPNAAGFGFIVHPPNQGGDPGIDRIWKFTDGGEFWLRSGDPTVYRSNPVGATPDIDTVRVHYKRFDGNYAPWGLHLWNGSGLDVARLGGLAIEQWGAPVAFASMPGYAAGAGEIVFDLPVLNPQADAARTGSTGNHSSLVGEQHRFSPHQGFLVRADTGSRAAKGKTG